MSVMPQHTEHTVTLSTEQFHITHFCASYVAVPRSKSRADP